MAGSKIEIYKYQLGRWHTSTFDVLPGQGVGFEKEVDSSGADPAAGASALQNGMAIKVVKQGVGTAAALA